MAVLDQEVQDRFALYNGDCVEVMNAMPKESIHLSVYSPPFGGLYNYSSSERDLSNCKDYDQFFEQYAFTVEELYRVTMPGRMSIVHCAEVPSGNTGCDFLEDFPGDIIRLHRKHGFKFCGRYSVWKEPLAVRLRTMQKNLAHKTIVDDATKCSVASADYMLLFRRNGKNKVPVVHPNGLSRYAGSRPMPAELQKYRGWKGKQTENRYSHWIWRQYASAFWDDVRLERVLPFKEARDQEDEKHVHPLQLDAIERAVVLWSNPGETVLSPFAGVGSEVYGALINDRRGVGIELKPSYYRQAVRNCRAAKSESEQQDLLAQAEESPA